MKITDKKNDQFRALSNNSLYGFTLDDFYWPSVTHYIEAKKFEGTNYEEIIRKSKTSLLVQKKTRGRNIIVVKNEDVNGIEILNYEKERFYGTRKDGYKIKEDWDQVKFALLKQAIKLKFEQHKILQKLLLLTSNGKLDCSTFNNDKNICAISSKILMKMRDNLLLSEMNSLTSISAKIQFETPPLNDKISSQKDLYFQFLTYQPCLDIVFVLIHLSKYISKIEKWDRVHPEMIEDAIYNIYNKKGKCYLPKGKISEESQPNLTQFTKNIRNQFIKCDRYQENDTKASEKIAKYVLWCTLRKNRLFFIHSKIKKFLSQMSDVPNFKNMEIVIPKVKREYRRQQPPKLKKDI